MDLDRWGQIQQLYHAALDRQPAARGEFLSKACGSDPELRREVESLLWYEGQADGLLESPVWNPDAHSDETRAYALGALSAGACMAEYRITGKLGSGGMGEVYRATDTKLQREVALKVLAVEFAHDSQWMARFQSEARVLASLNHPRIAAIHRLEESDGVYAIAMELVEGSTLAERIARRRIPIQELLVMAKQIAEALEYAHEKGIVHRDLKPANIMVTGEGDIKLLDFGLARRVRLAEYETAADTVESKIAGTIGYMSPEQVRGQPADGRTDLFSFGVVLYEMVTGERPFAGSSAMAVCDTILHAQPRDFGDSPAPGSSRRSSGNSSRRIL